MVFGFFANLHTQFSTFRYCLHSTIGLNLIDLNGTARQTLNLYEYREIHGLEAIFSLAEEVGAGREYLKAVSYGSKSAGKKLARKLIAATNGALTLEALLFERETHLERMKDKRAVREAS